MITRVDMCVHHVPHCLTHQNTQKGLLNTHQHGCPHMNMPHSGYTMATRVLEGVLNTPEHTVRRVDHTITRVDMCVHRVTHCPTHQDTQKGLLNTPQHGCPHLILPHSGYTMATPVLEGVLNTPEHTVRRVDHTITRVDMCVHRVPHFPTHQNTQKGLLNTPQHGCLQVNMPHSG
jgi:hypothetical protein